MTLTKRRNKQKKAQKNLKDFQERKISIYNHLKYWLDIKDRRNENGCFYLYDFKDNYDKNAGLLCSKSSNEVNSLYQCSYFYYTENDISTILNQIEKDIVAYALDGKTFAKEYKQNVITLKLKDMAYDFK